MKHPAPLRLLGALPLFAALSAQAAIEDQYRFEVLLDDKPIGEHRFEIDRRGAQARVESRAKFEVDFLFLTAYRYEHQSTELFENGCLKQIRAQTNDNGTRYKVDGSANGEVLKVDRGNSVETAEGCVKTFAYWDPAILKQQRLLNPQTGELERVAVRKRGTDEIKVDGRELAATRYTLDTGELAIDLWYHDELGWVRLASDTGKGATLVYRRL